MKLLVGYDGSDGADAMLRDLQKAGLPHEAEALIISVADVMMAPAMSNSEFFAQSLTSRRVAAGLMQAQKQTERIFLEAKAFSAKASERVRSYFPGWDVRAEVLAGQPAYELIRKADEWKPDLVVVGSHGHSALGRFILGSVSKKVVTDSSHSVRVTKGTVENDARTPPRLVIGVNGSVEAEQAVRAVGRRSWPDGTEVRIVAVDDGTSPARIARVLSITEALISDQDQGTALAAYRMVEWAENELSVIGLNVSVTLDNGDPQRVLLHEAEKWNADSIFVGGRSFSNAFERFRLGSVATALVTKAHCSVEVARNPDSESLA
jgi:nucleotide-binding universal stress UspA family protein